jgi:hypothetical protein
MGATKCRDKCFVEWYGEGEVCYDGTGFKTQRGMYG